VIPIVTSLVGALLVGYLPGALIYRLPIANRQKRGALPAEERAFWQVMISIGWSLMIVLALAAAGAYRYERLLAANAIVTLVVMAWQRQQLLWRGTAAKITIAAFVPLVVLGLGVWRFYPASEYIIGGKDPGVYINEGAAIDRTGQLFRVDKTIANVPEASRSLFFHKYPTDRYYGLRFMGMFINDPDTGEVIVQFPQLLSASVAVGFRLAGTAGATKVVALWATLGLLAVYFFGSRLIGRLAAFFAVLLLALNVVEVWYGRYPNTEVMMQAVLFSVLLAAARGHQDDDPFFAWVAGGLGGLLVFLRFDAYMALAGIAAALALRWIVEARAPRWGFTSLVVLGSLLGFAYYTGPMTQYFDLYERNLPSLSMGIGLFAVAAAITFGLAAIRDRLAPMAMRSLPMAAAGTLIALAAYALFLRQPEIGVLGAWDAFSLRTFRDAYVGWTVIIAALAGYAMVARREFWRDPAFFLVFAGFSFFFFYKIRVVPEQFWMARRFLPVILPGTLLLTAGALFGPSTPEHRRTVRRGVGAAVLMSLIGWQYGTAARPVAAHVEYKGAIRQVDQLAQYFTPRDLVIVESRDASDLHVLAVPLIDVYGLEVLVLESQLPDRRQFEAFLTQALSKYSRVFVIASGGTDLLSRRITATSIAFAPMKMPEYETTAWNEMPKGAREKDLGYSIYQLTAAPQTARGFDLDVGYLDDLQDVRLFAREVTEGRTFRWTSKQSFIAASGLTGNERQVEFVMHNGGRPAAAPPATVDVFFNEVLLGRLTVVFGFQTYRLTLPAELARAAAASPDPAQLRLVSSVWRPSEFGGGPDTREMGVMLDRVAIH